MNISKQYEQALTNNLFVKEEYKRYIHKPPLNQCWLKEPGEFCEEVDKCRKSFG